MENKYPFSIGGRVTMSVRPWQRPPGQVCEGRIETTSYIQTKNILKHVGLDMAEDASTAGFTKNVQPSAQRETGYSTNGVLYETH